MEMVNEDYEVETTRMEPYNTEEQYYETENYSENVWDYYTHNNMLLYI